MYQLITFKMKPSEVLLLLTSAILYQTSAYLIKVPTVPATSQNVASQSQVLIRQKMLIPLFENICEPSSDPTIRRLAGEFTIDLGDYDAPQIVTDFEKLRSSGLVPKGTIFTEYDVTHANELKIIFDVLYKANSFDAFYKAAAWSHENLNCGLYVNAIYMAIINRKDTQQMYIPPPYELLPNYFVNKDVIALASSILNGDEVATNEGIRFDGNIYTIDANYTAMFYDNDDDTKLAYFREDIGLNSYYFLRKLRLISYFKNNLNSNFGEHMYQMMRQFMSRYNLERYANGLPELEIFPLNSVLDVPYDPELIYSDGVEFGRRKSPINLPDTEDISILRTIEDNIMLIVSHMQQSGYNKTQILNHLMEILVTGSRSYETVARKYMGKSGQGYPSVLEHYMTSLRDPLFWKINKKIVDMVDNAMKLLPSYEKKELFFPGVEIVNVDVKKMMTAFDYFEFDVTEALSTKDSNVKFRLKIGQPRLNHKKFTIKVNISSLVPQKGIMKIYLGPKIMPGQLMEKKNLLTLMDVVEVNLKAGSNVIARSSDGMKHFSEDFISLNTVEKNVENAEYGFDSLLPKTIQSQIGYPSRLILPKGTPEGLPLQLFVFVAPYFKVGKGNVFSQSTMEYNTAILSPGYPLDLMNDERELFELPNAQVKYFTITQKTDSKVDNYGGPGVSKPWYSSNTYDSTLRPDYNSRNDEYFNKNDYYTPNEFKEMSIPDAKPIPVNSLDVIGINDGRNKLMASNVNYGANYRQPFDYKTKKAQYANRTTNYEKYRTFPKNPDMVSSTLPTETLSTRKTVMTEGRDEYDVNTNSSEEDFKKENFGVEPLPLPEMYRKDVDVEKFDYKEKKKESEFKIKTLKSELSKLIKNAERLRFMNSMVEPVTENVDIDNTAMHSMD